MKLTTLLIPELITKIYNLSENVNFYFKKIGNKYNIMKPLTLIVFFSQFKIALKKY